MKKTEEIIRLEHGIELLRESIKELDRDTAEAGKNASGVFIRYHGRARHGIFMAIEILEDQVRNSEYGIRSHVEEILAAGSIAYATVHPISPSAIGLYARDSSSPSGRIKVGGVPNTPLAVKILTEMGVYQTLSNAVSAF